MNSTTIITGSTGRCRPERVCNVYGAQRLHTLGHPSKITGYDHAATA